MADSGRRRLLFSLARLRTIALIAFGYGFARLDSQIRFVLGDNPREIMSVTITLLPVAQALHKLEEQ